MIMLASLSLLATEAQAGLIDEYASRYDWACSYGESGATCGGPDTWAEVDGAHTVEICDGATDEICGHTWRASGDRDLLERAMSAWGKQLETDLGGNAWVLTPARDPDTWKVALRSNETLATLEVGRGYVQAHTEERRPCVMRDAAMSIEEYILPVLPDMEHADRIVAALAAPWTEASMIQVEPMSPMLVARVLDRAPAERRDRESLNRWSLLASEPFQCIYELKKQTNPRTALGSVFEEWRKLSAPTRGDKRAARAAAREQARLGRKHKEVNTDDSTLSDDEGR